jgi:hypothetical protein
MAFLQLHGNYKQLLKMMGATKNFSKSSRGLYKDFQNALKKPTVAFVWL